ncbi:hypothetical protein APHAL10511_001391 [Amanita phalloides]|nr:hypothetical protein APHAL10511_001391 [Amanita phalloides]
MHVTCAQSPICHAAYGKSLASLDDPQAIDVNDTDMEDIGSQTFKGDLFGNYEDMDFDWPEDKQPRWNAGHHPAASIDETNEEEDDMGNVDDPSVELVDMEPPFSEDQPPVDNYIVEHFSRDTAGTPLNSTTLYALFSLQMDWEVAQ